MGTFSTKASSALEKVLKRKTLVEIGQVLNSLEQALDQVVVETTGIEREADRILDVTYYMDGKEIIDKGRLVFNLTNNLDGPSLTRAISTARSVHDSISAERARWALEEEAKHKTPRGGIALKFKLNPQHGPGTASWLLGH